ncbi:YhjD/YihY/BrkB family envelope integrity protein [Tessaracoccus sp.]
MRRPWVAHLLAANERFGKRLGPQFAGAVTYFSVLSMVPVLMFGVAVLGLTVTVLRPDLLSQVQNLLTEQLGATTGITANDDTDTGKFAQTIATFVTSTFKNWAGIGLIALLAAAYSGSNWVKNLKHAVRAMWKDKFAQAATTGSFVGELIGNLITFFGLLLSVAVAVGVTAAGQAFPEQIIGWLGLAGVPGIGLLLQLVSLIVSFLASWLLFAFLFVVLPGDSVRLPTFLRATITGAVLLTGLQRLAGVLVSLLSGNASAGIFGPIIILMIVFNILATIILMLAAWVGTADSWESERAKHEADKAAGIEQQDDTGLDDEAAGNDAPDLSRATTAARHRAARWSATIPQNDLRAENFDPARVAVEDPDATVSQGVAARSVRVGMGVGYGVGAATGIGLGAAIAALVGKIARR